jgi:20S proteasome alpha/beta subunit
MTIVAGFYCSDGVLLASDTLITLLGGIGKKYESKIFEVNYDLGMFLTYSGDPDFAKEYANVLRQSCSGKSDSGALAAAKNISVQFYRNHFFDPPDDAKTYAAMLLTLRQGSSSVSLYSVTEKHFLKVSDRYVVLGIGQDQAESFFDPYYRSGMDLRACERVARYGIFKAKKFVQGCGGNTEIEKVLNKPRPQGIKTISTLKSGEIDGNFEFCDSQIGKMLIAYSDFSVTQKEFRLKLKKSVKALEERRQRTLDDAPKAFKEYFDSLD